MNPLTILLVEDNAADVAFFREALEATGIPAKTQVAENGEQALRFLRRQDDFASAPRPDIIILDLNIPLNSGHEVLAELAADETLSTIPVAVLTTSTSETCLSELYPPGRCLYFSKTDDFTRLQNIVRKIAAHAGR